MAALSAIPNASEELTSWDSPSAGITAGYSGDSISLRIFTWFIVGLSIYNALELAIIVFLTFSRRSGLYFWSLLVSSCLGVIPYATGFLLKYLNYASTGPIEYLPVTLITVGWWCMITGQSVVLWSRLHLIVHGETGDKILKYTKWMIMADIILLHVPTTIVTYGANGSTDTDAFAAAYSIIEKIQVTGFFVQEVILSSIYIVETYKILRTSLKPRTRRTMRQLIIINIIIICMDLFVLAVEAASLYILQTLCKVLIYSIKLKLEFAILSKLINFVGGPRPEGMPDPRRPSIGFMSVRRQSSSDQNCADISEFVDLSRVRSDLTNPSRYSDSALSRRRASKLEYDIARFAHTENMLQLEDGMCGARSGQDHCFGEIEEVEKYWEDDGRRPARCKIRGC